MSKGWIVFEPKESFYINWDARAFWISLFKLVFWWIFLSSCDFQFICNFCFLRKFFWRWKSNVHEWICGGALLSVTLRHNERSKTFPYMGIASPAFLSPSAAVALHYMMPIYGDFESIEAADNEVTFQRTNIYMCGAHMGRWIYGNHISLIYPWALGQAMRSLLKEQTFFGRKKKSQECHRSGAHNGRAAAFWSGDSRVDTFSKAHFGVILYTTVAGGRKFSGASKYLENLLFIGADEKPPGKILSSSEV